MAANATQIALFPGFAHSDVDVGDGITIHCAHGGSGPPLLLHPRLSADACDLAQGRAALAQDYSVVCPDLRGYGDSSKPAGVAGSLELLEARDGTRPGAADAIVRIRALRRRRTRSRRTGRASDGARSSRRRDAALRARHLADAHDVRADDDGVRACLLPLVLPDPARAAIRRR